MEQNFNSTALTSFKTWADSELNAGLYQEIIIDALWLFSMRTNQHLTQPLVFTVLVCLLNHEVYVNGSRTFL